MSNRKLIFLVDTEASVSLLRVNSVENPIDYNKNEIISLTGITKEPILTLGTRKVVLNFGNSIINHKFHIVSDKFPIPAHGIIGKDFIKPNKCLINYGAMTLTVQNRNKIETIPIHSELLNGLSVVPPRSESFKVFHIKSNTFPCVVESQMIDENIFIPTTIANSENTWIRVLNTNDEYKLINTEKVETKSINNYDILKIDTANTQESGDRHSHLRELFNSKIPNHAKAKLMPLCLEFSDIFHLETDKATVNNFYEQELNVQDKTPIYTKNYRLQKLTLCKKLK